MAKRLVKRARSGMAQRFNIRNCDPKLALELDAQTPKFFVNSAQFREWLSQHAATTTALVVGFYKFLQASVRKTQHVLARIGGSGFVLRLD